MKAMSCVFNISLRVCKDLGNCFIHFYGEKLKAKVRIFGVFYNLKKNVLNFNVNR